MGKPKINVHFNSPWLGNQLFEYAFAKSYAEMHDCVLHTLQPWRGQAVFMLDDPPIDEELPKRVDHQMSDWHGEVNIQIDGYAQRQPCMIYTREDAKRFFQFKPEILELLENNVPKPDIAAHLRHGDFLGVPGFVAVSKESFIRAAVKFGIDPEKIDFVHQENPAIVGELGAIDAAWCPDFWKLMTARILFRANSTYSWWAAVLGNAERIFSPVIDGIPGSDGEFREAEFVEGNWPKTANHWFCTDMHVRENDNDGAFHLGGADNVVETWMPDIWEGLIEKYDIRSVIDIGCGRGQNAKWFLDRGIYTIGVEGNLAYLNRGNMPLNKTVLHDYTMAPYVPETAFDLCWSSEFVEHVEEKHIPNFIATFQRCKFVCLTHATPGQGGHHHVNEQTTEYWVKKMEDAGFQHILHQTREMRATGPDTDYGRRTLTFFKNKNRPTPIFEDKNRWEYDLNEKSVVVDCGGYEGNFAKLMVDKYGCRVHVFEPVKEFYDNICNSMVPGMQVRNEGISDVTETVEFGVQNDYSGAFANGIKKEKVQLSGVIDVFKQLSNAGCEVIDVMKINIEGGEYKLLQCMLDNDLVKKVKNLQIQWHGNGPLFGDTETIPDVTERRRRISARLMETHKVTWEMPWVWENYQLK